MSSTTPPKKKPAAKKPTAKKPTEADLVQEANTRKISPVGNFKKRLGGITELPSGEVVRLHNPGGLAAFLGTGTIPNGLMPLVQEQLSKSKNNTPLNEEELSQKIEADPSLILEMSDMIDGVTIRCLVEPQCHPIPGLGEERSDDLLYVDEVSMGDKQFIFSWLVSGAKDLEPFRN